MPSRIGSRGGSGRGASAPDAVLSIWRAIDDARTGGRGGSGGGAASAGDDVLSNAAQELRVTDLVTGRIGARSGGGAAAASVRDAALSNVAQFNESRVRDLTASRIGARGNSGGGGAYSGRDAAHSNDAPATRVTALVAPGMAEAMSMQGARRGARAGAGAGQGQAFIARHVIQGTQRFEPSFLRLKGIL